MESLELNAPQSIQRMVIETPVKHKSLWLELQKDPSVEGYSTLREIIKDKNFYNIHYGDRYDALVWGALKVAFPQQVERDGLPQSLRLECVSEVDYLLKRVHDREPWNLPGVFKRLAWANSLFPGIIAQTTIHQTDVEKAIVQIQKDCSDKDNAPSQKAAARLTLWIAMLFPEHRHRLLINQDTCNALQDALHKTHDQSRKSPLSFDDRINNVGWDVVALHSLYPGKSLRVRPQEFFDYAKIVEMLKLRKELGQWQHYIDYVATVKILSAQDVRWNGAGFEFIEGELDKQAEVPQIPEQKKF